MMRLSSAFSFVIALFAPSLGAEITPFMGDAAYIYQHPTLRSLVFISPQARQMAILPPPPVFLPTPPLLWRAPSQKSGYPSAAVITAGQLNAPARASNLDLTTYHLLRANAVSQEQFHKAVLLNFNAGSPAAFYVYDVGWLGYSNLYPPPQQAGFNQPARASNNDLTRHHLERAHRFSQDRYQAR